MGQIIKSLKTLRFSRTDLSIAIAKDGRTLDQILEDVEKEKALELDVINLYYKKDWGIQRVATYLGITQAKVIHILKFDELGLSYRKINNKT